MQSRAPRRSSDEPAGHQRNEPRARDGGLIVERSESGTAPAGHQRNEPRNKSGGRPEQQRRGNCMTENQN